MQNKKDDFDLGESYKDIVENSPDMIHSVDDKGFIVYANKKECKVLGYKRSEIIGKHLKDIYAPELYKEVEKGFKVLKKKGELHVSHGKMLKRNGDVIEVQIDSIAIYDKNHHFIRTRSIVHDVTEMSEISEQLMLKGRALDTVTSGIIITDAEQKDNPIIYSNDAFTEITGYTKEEVLGKNCRFLQGKHTNGDSAKLIGEAIKKGEPIKLQLYNYKKDGTSFWNDLTISPVKNDAGKVTHYVGILVDITDQIETLKQVTGSEARYKDIVENSPDMIHSVDAKGRILFVNRKSIEMLGYTEDELIGMDVFKLYAPELIKDVKKGFEKLKKEGAIYIPHGHVVTKTGEKIEVEIDSVAAYDQDGNFVRTRSILHDITGRRIAERALQDKVEQMEFMGRLNLKRHKKMKAMEKEIDLLQQKIRKLENNNS